MKIIKSCKELTQTVKKIDAHKSRGFVPTMGALHEGHLSLIRKSKAENDITIVSIYVNATQFNNKNDLQNYPIRFDEDLELLEREEVDILFAPDYENMYPDIFSVVICEKELATILCGKTRPGHFEGVLTIVAKLLNLAAADRAYFGEKDYQQFLLIKKMAEALFFPTKIIPCPIVREESGLALSSRNRLLSENALHTAASLYRELSSGKTRDDIYSALEKKGFQIDYLEEFEDRLFAAVFIENVRLIDNVKI